MYLLELAGEDDRFARAEAASHATGVEAFAPGLARAGTVDREGIGRLAYTHAACRLVGHADPDVEAAVALLCAAGSDGDGSVAVRARDVRGSTGVDTRRAERELGAVLVEAGHAVDLDDPDRELRALFAAGEVAGEERSVCALGWTVAESRRDFSTRQPTDRPFFQPGSMDPLLARALVNLAGAAPGATILDPMCGTGGTLIEAGLVGARAIGSDAQPKMVRGTRRNLRTLVPHGDWALVRADATALPLAGGAADGVVFDAPYGRQSKIAGHELAALVEGALAEARRVAPRAVVVADRSWREAALAAGWTVEARFERRVHRSLTRYVLVLSDRTDHAP